MRMVALDTSVRSTGVALVAAGQVVAETWIGSGRSSAALLLPALADLLKAAGWSREMVEAVAVVVGPGSFTGLRIGVTTAKGLAYAWQVPIIGVTSLEVLAAGAVPLAAAWQMALPSTRAKQAGKERPTVLIVPVIPSRRGECYLQVFAPVSVTGRPGSGFERVTLLGPTTELPEPLCEPQVVSLAEWASGRWLPTLPGVQAKMLESESLPVILVGPASLTGELIRLWKRPSLRLYAADLAIYPGIVGRVASVRATGSTGRFSQDAGRPPFQDAMELMPLYLGKREGEPAWPPSQHPTPPSSL